MEKTLFARGILSGFILLLSLIFAPSVYAKDSVAGTSASQVALTTVSEATQSAREKILQGYLEQFNSPLASYAGTFVNEADKNNIDWKLVAAISGVESTFGQAVPFNCNNAWGYGIYGSNTRCFDTYDQAIAVISKDLREKYMGEWGAQDVYAIGRIYAASPTWATRVEHFMNEIETFALQYKAEPLPISL